MRDVKKIIKERRGKVNPHYDLDGKAVLYFHGLETCDEWKLIEHAFLYGYEMGVRATKAEQKQKRKSPTSGATLTGQATN